MQTPSSSVIALYDQNASGWDEDRQYQRPAGEQRWIARFTGAAEPASQLLDLGCGAGQPIVPDLLAAGHRVTGIDGAASLIALCRQRFADQEWQVADMRGLNLGRVFGGVLAWHSLFHLSPDDQADMFPVFARHLRPGAPLMFTSGTQRGETLGRWRGKPLYHASLDLAEYEALLAANRLALIGRVVDDPDCGGATIWLARLAA
ncbi:class I SAM-dependent methyltransferase [Hyphomonas sp. NPDC076900]|uniref:class I SAM-dependent methyltransferase n=1 Tax=unclassified Hyphomonas TaxID=2630699 RepID=UPI003D05C914